MISPRSEQLDIPPEYGTPSRLLAWDVVAARLADARHYWLATVRPDGRPHVVPSDGLWLEDRWYFGGSDKTVKHRNLLSNPLVTLHLEDAASAVIVEGTCAIARHHRRRPRVWWPHRRRSTATRRRCPRTCPAVDPVTGEGRGVDGPHRGRDPLPLH